MGSLTQRWKRSTRCSLSDECVEVAQIGETIHIRDSKDVVGGSLVVGLAAWRAFLTAVEDGTLAR